MRMQILVQDAQRAPLVLDPFAIQKGAVGCVQVHQVWLNLQAIRPFLVTLSIPAVTFGAPQALHLGTWRHQHLRPFAALTLRMKPPAPSSFSCSRNWITACCLLHDGWSVAM